MVEYHPEYKQEVISPETAYLMVDMMRELFVVEMGTMEQVLDYAMCMAFDKILPVKLEPTKIQPITVIAMTPHLVMGSWVGGEDRRIRFPTDRAYSIGQGARTASNRRHIH